MDAEKIVHDVAERVRELISEAETRAGEIVREAEADAKRIRERAEVEGRERLEEVRRALDELQGRLGAGAEANPAAAVKPGAEVEPGPVVVPEPEPPAPDPGPERIPEPEPPLIPEPTPPPDEGTPPVAGNGDASRDDSAPARLVAMNMALDGASREQIEAKLVEDYELTDAGAIADDVLTLAKK